MAITAFKTATLNPQTDLIFTKMPIHDTIDYVSPADLHRWLSDTTGSDTSPPFVVVDVRDEDVGDYGRIPKSVHAPSDTFLMHLHTIDAHISEALSGSKKQPVHVIFHCMQSQIRGPSCARKYHHYLQSASPPVSSAGQIRVCILEGGMYRYYKTYGNPSRK